MKIKKGLKLRIVLGIIIAVALIIAIAGYFILFNSSNSKASYPIDSIVLTTVDRTIVTVPVPPSSPIINPTEIAKYAEYGYGKWTFGKGKPYEKRLDLMPDSYNDTNIKNKAKLLNFFAMTDIHLVDKESPAQGIYFGYIKRSISAYSGIMLYTTHVLDSVIQTVNALNKKEPFDFGIFLGDNINSAQYNEIRWFIDVLDGKEINPDSGIKDDPIPGPHNDYQDKFQSAGLDKSIKWYQVIGNHDHFWTGIYPPTDYIKDTYVGENIIQLGNIFTPEGIYERSLYMGTFNGSTIYGDIIGMGPANKTVPITIAADSNRHYISSIELASEFFNTSSNPIGHGFNKADVNKGFLCYSFEPKSNIPFKVIVLDDTQKDNDPSTNIHGHSYLDTERYEWLVNELEQGQNEGKLMIIALHVPIGLNNSNPEMSWDTDSPITEEELIAKLHSYPNLILLTAGHRHLNTVTVFKSPDMDYPELGFWQVETSSLREFSQEFRTFKIVRNSDNTLSIFITNVDPAVKEGSFAAISRSYAIAANQIFNINFTEPYNAELVVPLSPEMQDKIQNYGTLLNN